MTLHVYSNQSIPLQSPIYLHLVFAILIKNKVYVWKSCDWTLDWTWNAIPKSDNEQRKAELEKTAKGLDERLEAEANRLKVS